jgi:hypothetical protein
VLYRDGQYYEMTISIAAVRNIGPARSCAGDEPKEFARRILKNRQGKHIRLGSSKQALLKWIAGGSAGQNARGSGKNFFVARSFVLVSA